MYPSPTGTWHRATYPSLSPSRSELSCAGKSVLITGGGAGIGAETALRFAEAGASRIAILGRRQAPLEETKARINMKYPKVEVFTASVDITDQSDLDSAFERFLGKTTIDILVCSASTLGPQGTVNDVEDIELYLDAVQSNLRGAIVMTRAFLRHASANNAVVINTSSATAHTRYAGRNGSYSVSKMAVYKLWEQFGGLNPNIRVHHLHPGVIDTDMNKEALRGRPAGPNDFDDISLPSTFTVWLASPEAKFLNGKYVWCHWDVDELLAQAKEIESSRDLEIGMIGWPSFEKLKGQERAIAGC